jgi:hypothetical protein
MDGCIQGELHDDDQKAAMALPVSSEVLSKMWGEFWIHAQGFGTNFFEPRRIFSQVSEGVCCEKHVSCVWIRIMDAGKAICRSKDTHMHW